MPDNRSGRRVPGAVGFTLVEVMAALAVLGVVLALLGQAQQFGVAAWTHQTRSLAVDGDLEGVDRLLRHLVTAVDPAGMHGTTAEFVGSAHAIAFTSVLLVPGFDTREVDAALMVAANTGLELSLQPHYRRLLGPRPAPLRQQVLSGVTGLDISYTAVDGAWKADWRGPTMPRLIRFHFEFATAGQHWPDIVVAPMRNPWQP